jgi:dihydroorotate dehydrogenase
MKLSAETAHGFAIWAMKAGWAHGTEILNSRFLRTTVWGIDFPNPLGLAAGFDKNADVADAALALGFGLTEVGTVTPLAQPGNPKPRMFRLPQDQGVINRLGFNNKGLNHTIAQLKKRKSHNDKRGASGIVGANFGANKDSGDRIADYVTGITKLAGLADYYVMNISSPNTPGLRALQSKEALVELVGRTLEARKKAYKDQNLGKPAPLLVKVAPDLTNEDIDDIVDVTRSMKIDGLVISNTTITRPKTLKSHNKSEEGGLSGKPLFDLSTDVLRQFYSRLEGKVPLIGVGGVASGQDALDKLKAGASLVQLYSAMAYQGPALPGHILNDLALRTKAEGFASMEDATGADHR